MCGIAGAINLPDIKNAKDTLAHRGPDSFGIWEEGNVFLVHRRLAILDLSSAGHQPMEFENLVISYNGEVYNYKEIRSELKKSGYSFQSRTDTEVILKAYHYWGATCVKKFNGMFAFGIYHKDSGKMYVARDQVGIKPLYYFHKNEVFAFGSELKAFPKAIKEEVNIAGLIKFLILSYIPAPDTAYQNVFKLEPGHYLEFENEEIKTTKYWSFSDKNTHQSNYHISSYEDAINLIEEKLKASVAMQLVADVPVGSFLSGGVDSSLITALAQAQSPTPIKTYAMGFAEKAFDESPFAEEVAKHLKTEHTTLTFSPKDLIEMTESYDYYFDEPFGDSASLPLSVLCKKAKEQGITVALSGDGGDELFLGYDRYQFATKYYDLFKNKPAILRSLVTSLFKISKNDRALKMIYPIKFPSMINFYQLLYTCIKPWDIKSAIKKEVLVNEFGNTGVDIYDVLNLQKEHLVSEKDLAEIDLLRNLPDDMLTKADRASMRYSLEMRVPILDREILEISAALPNEFLLHEGVKKSILKDILYKYVPKHLIDRPKRGFTVPIALWLRNELRQEVESLPNDLPDFINSSFVVKIIDEHLNLGRNHSYIIWNLLRLAKFTKSV